MSDKNTITNFGEYIAEHTPEKQEILKTIRQTVKEVFPDAEETISYRMPAFRLKKVFFYYAAFKNHVGIYPPLKGDEELIQELLPYRGEKGNLKFPLNKPIPYGLIRRVAIQLAQEYGRQ